METTKLEFSTYVINKNHAGPFHGSDNSQQVLFEYDKNIKGKLVAMTLFSRDGKGMDAPNLEIYFKNEDLKKILEFLIESEK